MHRWGGKCTEADNEGGDQPRVLQGSSSADAEPAFDVCSESAPVVAFGRIIPRLVPHGETGTATPQRPVLRKPARSKSKLKNAVIVRRVALGSD